MVRASAQVAFSAFALMAACSADRTGRSSDGSGNTVTTHYRGAFTLTPQTAAPYSEVDVLATLQMSDGTAQCGGYTVNVALTGGTGPTLGCGSLSGSTITFMTLGPLTVLREYRPGFATADVTASDLQLTMTGIDPESFTASFQGSVAP
jgi:hypothetical protein